MPFPNSVANRFIAHVSRTVGWPIPSASRPLAKVNPPHLKKLSSSFFKGPKITWASCMSWRFTAAVWLLAALCANPMGRAAAQMADKEPPVRDASGVWRHTLRSPRQSGETELRVLLPPDLEAAWRKEPTSAPRVPVVYLLPVEANRESRYGDPIRELLDRKLHERFGVVFAAPTFSRLPWYADHPNRDDSRQEAYFMEDIVPLVESRYPVKAERAGRMLLGFSKSGWGAWALLLLHPDRFERAAAWDAPLMMDRPGLYGSGDIFGDVATFRRYEISALLRQRAEKMRGPAAPRLVLTGYGNFRSEHERTHVLLDDLSVPHVYRDGPKRLHDWHSGWVAEALELLMTPRSDR